MDKLFAWLFPDQGSPDEGNDRDNDDERRRRRRRRRRSRDRERGDDESRSRAAAGTGRDARAYHESVWKTGRIAANVPHPPFERLNINGRNVHEIAAKNLLVLFLGAPGVGVKSFINRVRFGDMSRTTPATPFAVYPPQYLCDGSVYNVAMARLPATGFSAQSFEDVQHLAVVLAYAVDSPASLKAAQRLQRRLFREVHRPARPPFPVLLLGLKSDTRSGDLADGPDVISEHALVVAAQENQQRTLESWAFAWSRNMLHSEVSAKRGDGVLEALGSLVEEVHHESEADDDPEQTLGDMREFWIPAVALVSETRDRARAATTAGEESRRQDTR